MDWGRWVEFYEGDSNRLSMARLLTFLSFFPATYEMIRIDSAEALGYYLGAYVLNYIGGKASDCMKTRRGRDDDSGASKE